MNELNVRMQSKHWCVTFTTNMGTFRAYAGFILQSPGKFLKSYSSFSTLATLNKARRNTERYSKSLDNLQENADISFLIFK